MATVVEYNTNGLPPPYHVEPAKSENFRIFNACGQAINAKIDVIINFVKMIFQTLINLMGRNNYRNPSNFSNKNIVTVIENNSKNPVFQVFCKTHSGYSITFSVKKTDTILKLKELISKRENILPDQQRLLFAGHECQDDRSLEEHQIQKESTLHLVKKIRGS